MDSFHSDSWFNKLLHFDLIQTEFFFTIQSKKICKKQAQHLDWFLTQGEPLVESKCTAGVQHPWQPLSYWTWPKLSSDDAGAFLDREDLEVPKSVT